MTKRGRILRDTNAGPGLLTVEGHQYAFTLEGIWKSDVPPKTGSPVEVMFSNEGALEGVYAIAEGQLAREQAHNALAGALRNGGSLKKQIGRRYHAGVLVAEGLLLISFFLLPSLQIGVVTRNSQSFTGWDATGLDMSLGTATDHGLLSILGVVCMLAPLAAPFLRQWWARWLNTAPLLFTVLAFITVRVEIGDAVARQVGIAGDAGALMTRQMLNAFHTAAGLYAMLLCSLYLCSRAVLARD